MNQALKRWLIALGVTVLLVVGWVGYDLYRPLQRDIRRFNPETMGKLETEMWRAYYDKKPLLVYSGMYRILTTQYHFPTLRGALDAYRATRAALIFKEGSRRVDYEKALPLLTLYYKDICQVGGLACDPERIASLELEWWITHRERYGGSALADAIAAPAAAMYQLPHANLGDYAAQRAVAMMARDISQEKGELTPSRWKQIEDQLISSYQSLSQALQGTSGTPSP